MDSQEKHSTIESPMKPWRDAAGAFGFYGAMFHGGFSALTAGIHRLLGGSFKQEFIHSIHSKVNMVWTLIMGGIQAYSAYHRSQREQQDVAALKTENAQLRGQVEQTGQALTHLVTQLGKPVSAHAERATPHASHRDNIAAEKSSAQEAVHALR